MTCMELSQSDAQTGQSAGIGVVHRLGVIGLGRMGGAFAANLLAAGYEVHVFDPKADRVEALTVQGAQPMDGPSAVAGLEAVITSLPDDATASAVTLGPGGLAERLAKGAAHISMSTVSPDLCRRMAEAHANSGAAFVAAPVLGNPDLARDRRLFVIASGDETATLRVVGALRALSQRAFYLGEDPGAAALMKLGANTLTALTLQSLGEVLAFLAKAGVAPEDAFQVLSGSLFDGKVHKAYGGKILAKRWSPPGLTASLACKDLRLALAEAERAHAPMPAASLTHDRLVALMARGWADLDWSALGLLASVEAGLPGEPDR